MTSFVTGHAVRMVAGGWWPADEDVADPVDVAVWAERTDTDEVAITLRGLGTDENPGTLYLTPRMAASLANWLVSAATSPPPEEPTA